MLIKAKIKMIATNAFLYIMGMFPMACTLLALYTNLVKIVCSGAKPDIRWAIGGWVALMMSATVLIVCVSLTVENEIEYEDLWYQTTYKGA